MFAQPWNTKLFLKMSYQVLWCILLYFHVLSIPFNFIQSNSSSQSEGFHHFHPHMHFMCLQCSAAGLFECLPGEKSWILMLTPHWKLKYVCHYVEMHAMSACCHRQGSSAWDVERKRTSCRGFAVSVKIRCWGMFRSIQLMIHGPWLSLDHAWYIMLSDCFCSEIINHRH